MERLSRNGIACPFQPDDRLVGARLQQMNVPDPRIPISYVGVAGAEADGLLLGRDRLLYRPGEALAPAEIGYSNHPGSIAGDRRLVFGNGLLAPALRAQQKGPCAMRRIGAW